MKVFLSWSGPKSKAVAEALYDWLPNVIQAVKPWMSSEDIDKGATWDGELTETLNVAKAGVVCVTPENQDAPWLNFEAGALAKTSSKPVVCTYLFGLKPTDITGPLKRFQATEPTEEHTRQLISTLNKTMGESALSDVKLAEAFEKWWPNLRDRLAAIPAEPSAGAARGAKDMLEEVLLITRNLNKLANDVQRRYLSDRAAINNWFTKQALRSLWGSHSVRHHPTPLTQEVVPYTLQQAFEDAILQAEVLASSHMAAPKSDDNEDAESPSKIE